MTRRRWVQIDGELVEVGQDYIPEPRVGVPHVIPDLPSFVSPIDGKTYSGRAGMRDHCAKHNVVPTADLKGLPIRSMNQQIAPDRAAIREAIRRRLEK